MKTDITKALVEEHTLILRMLTILEKKADATAAGIFKDYAFYLQAVEFIRNYADRYHHAKEEDVLFEALVKNGMPRENSPVAAMLMEHDQGRAYVKAMETAALAALAGESDQDAVIAENARGYAAMLREHIAKEDDVLYPLAERVLPEAVREGIINGYALAEARTGAGFAQKYQAVVAAYDTEDGARAA